MNYKQEDNAIINDTIVGHVKYTDYVKFISQVASLYLGVSQHSVCESLLNNQTFVKNALLDSKGGKPLLVSADALSTENEKWDIRTHRGWDDLFGTDRKAVAFIGLTCYGEKVIQEDDGLSKTMLPLFWNCNLSPCKLSLQLLEDIINPILMNEKYKYCGDNKRHDLVNDALNSIMRTINIFRQIDSKSSIEPPYFVIGESLSRVVTYGGPNAKRWDIQIPSEAMLEDIKQNVVQWSVEVARILGLYHKMLNNELSSATSSVNDVVDGDIISSETITSDSSSDTYSSFSDSDQFENSQRIDMFDGDANVEDSSTKLSMGFHIEKPINVEEETTFWLHYEMALMDLHEQLCSPLVENTISLLEYNNVDVKSIYSFDDAMETTSRMLDWVENINIIMRSFPVGYLKGVGDVGVLKDGIYIVLKHLSKARFLKHYSSNKLSDIILGLTVEMLASCAAIIGDGINKAIDVELSRDLFKSIEEIMTIWNHGVEALKADLDIDGNSTVTFFTGECNNRISEARDVLQAIEQSIHRYLSIYADAAIIVEMKIVFNGNLQHENIKYCEKIVDVINQSNSLCKSMLDSYSLNIKNKIQVNESFDFNDILPCVHTFNFALTQIENTIMTTFRSCISDISNLDSIPQVLYYVTQFSSCEGGYLTDVFENVVNIIADEVEALETITTMPNVNNVNPVYYITISDSGAEAHNIARIKGKLMVRNIRYLYILQVLEKIVKRLGLVVGSETIKNLINKMGKLHENVNTLILQCSTECGLQMCRKMIDITKGDVEEMQCVILYPFDNSLDNLGKWMYMAYFGMSVDYESTAEMHTILSIVLIVRHIFRSFNEIGELKAIYDKQNSTNALYLPEPFSLAIQNMTWENLMIPDTLETVYNIVHSEFLDTSRSVALIGFLEDIKPIISTLTATQLLLTILSYVKSIKSSEETHVDYEESCDTKYIIDMVLLSIKTWNETKANNITMQLEHELYNNSRITVTFKEEDSLLHMDPTIETLKGDLYNDIAPKINAPMYLLNELSALCNVVDRELENLFDCLIDTIKRKIDSILTNLDNDFQRHKNFINHWETHFIMLSNENATTRRLVEELDKLEQGLLTNDNPVGPANMLIPERIKYQQVKRLEMNLFQIVCNHALKESRNILQQLSDIGMQRDISPSNKTETNLDKWQFEVSIQLPMKHTSSHWQIEDLIKSDEFKKLLACMTEQPFEPTDAKSILNTYVDYCIRLDPFLISLYNAFAKNDKLTSQQAAWTSHADAISTLENICKEKSLDPPNGWIYSATIKENVELLFDNADQHLDEVMLEDLKPISQLPVVYEKLEHLLDLTWQKTKDKIDQGYIDHNDILCTIEHIAETENLLGRQDLAVRELLVQFSFELHLTTNTERFIQLSDYKTQWGNAKVFLNEYDKILEQDTKTTTKQNIVDRLTYVDEGLNKLNSVCKVMKNKVNKIYSLLNGTIGTYLNNDDFILRLKDYLSNFKSPDIKLEESITINQWLLIHDTCSEAVNFVLKSYEFNKMVRDWIETLSEKYDTMELPCIENTIPLWDVPHDGSIEIPHWKNINSTSIMYAIDDSLAILNTYISSIYAEELKGDINEWITTLSGAKIEIERWKNTETQLQYLYNLFRSSTVRKKLANEAQLLNCILKEYNMITVSLTYVNDLSRCEEKLSEIANSIKDLEDRLGIYLDEQRFICPRYFFLRDDELFHIIGMVNIDEMKSNISKMFPGIFALECNDGSITGIKSKDGDSLPLDENIIYETVEPYKVLMDMHTSIKNSIRSQILRCHEEFTPIYCNEKMNPDAFWGCFSRYVSQALVVSLSVSWTRCMESTKSSNEATNLHILLNKMIDILSKPPQTYISQRKKMEKISIVLIYQLQKSKLLPLQNLESWDWQRCIRYYINRKNDVELHIGHKVHIYGYEFMGVGPPMIITPLTETCLISISEAMDNCLIPNPQGPAGTGKTESIKVLAELCGHPFWIFNCSEGFDSISMERIFAGLCQMGAWGIFDEFNRLIDGVLSSIAEKIQQMIKCKKGNIGDITLVNRKILLDKNVGIFITINPGYISRRQFPLNLRKLCRPIIMENVDLKQIIHAMLMLNGISDSSLVSKTLWDILHCCRICFGELIYDFGLRCSKSILLHISMNLHRDNNKNPYSVYSIIDYLKTALSTVILPRLLSNEKCVLNTVVVGCLPKHIAQPDLIHQTSDDQHDAFVKLFDSQYETLSEVPNLKEKCSTLFSLMKLTKGIILYGPSGSGKTLCLSATVNIMRQINGGNYDVIRFDPNAIDPNELYGNDNNGSWQEGLFSYTLRQYSCSPRNLIIIFDGDIYSSWVENMNSLLDDNLVLTLTNGHRIPLTPNVTILFETHSLQHVTLATTSRCSLIRFEIKESYLCIPEYKSYFDFLDTDIRLHRYHLFKALYLSSHDYVNFIFSFALSYGSYMGKLEWQSFLDKIDDISKPNEQRIVYTAAAGQIVGESNNSELHIIVKTLLLHGNSAVFTSTQNSDLSVIIGNIVSSIDGWFLVTMYLSKNAGRKAIMKVLQKHTVITLIGSNLTMLPIEKLDGASRMVLLIEDIDCLTTEPTDLQCWSLIRELVEFKALFTKNETDNWTKVHLKDISIFLATKQPSPNLIPQRLRKSLPVINIELLLDCRNYTQLTIPGTVDDTESIEFDASQRDGFRDKLIYLNIDLSTIEHFSESFQTLRQFLQQKCNRLIIMGCDMHLRKILCEATSSFNGYKITCLDHTSWNSTMVNAFQNAVFKCEKICIYIDWDLLVLQSPEVACEMKHMIITGDYSSILSTDVTDICENKAHLTDVESSGQDIQRSVFGHIKYIISTKTQNVDASLISKSMLLTLPHLSSNFKASVQNALMPADFKFDMRKIYDIYVGKFRQKSSLSDFLVYIISTKDNIIDNKTAHMTEYKHFETGIKRINNAKSEIASMQTILDSQRTKLVEKNEEAKIKVDQITKLKNEAKIKQEKANEMKISLEKEKGVLIDRNKEIQHQLEAVAPLIEESQKEIESINRKSLDELRSMSNPPSIIKDTMEMVVLLLTNSTSSNIAWDICRKVIKSADFITKIVQFNTQALNPVTVSIVKERLKNPSWDKDRISKASKAAGPLARWVESILRYGEIALNVAPLLKEVELLKESNAKNEELLNAQSELIMNLENDIDQYQVEYSDLVQSIADVKTEIENASLRLVRSEKIMSNLSTEVGHWNNSIATLERNNDCIIGNAILVSSLLNLCGMMKSHDRKKFYKMVTDVLKQEEINYSVDPSYLDDCTSRMIQSNMKYRHCIILDATDMMYIKYIDGDYKKVSACDEHFLSILYASKKCNLTLVITDIVYAHTNIKHVILDEVLNKGKGLKILFEISTDDIRRCEQLKTEDDHYIQNIFDLCYKLRLKMTEEHFNSFCLDILMKEINPTLYNAHTDVIITQHEIKGKLHGKEDELLGILSTTEDILADNLSDYLDEYRNERDKLHDSLSECEKVVDRFNKFIMEHSDFTSLISSLYNTIKKLESINSMYAFDVYMLLHAMKNCHSRPLRNQVLIKVVYSWVCQSIFTDDLLNWTVDILNIYYNQVDRCADINNLLEEISQPQSESSKLYQKIEHMRQIYLQYDDSLLFGIQTDIFDYYNLIIVVTKSFDDPTEFLYSYATSKGHELKTLAMSTLADMSCIISNIEVLLSEGYWVVLKNAHLMPSWFERFECQFPNKSDSPKLFVTWDHTMSINRNIMLRRYRLIYQGADSFQSTFHRLYQLYSHLFIDCDLIKSHLMMKAVLVHAIIICRQSYIPYGWTQMYLFDLNDLSLALNATTRFLEIHYNELNSYNGSILEFQQSSLLLKDWKTRIYEIYQPKISHDLDCKILYDIICFTDIGKYIIPLPSLNILEWIEMIPNDRTSSSLIGLPDFTETLMLESKFRKLRNFRMSSAAHITQDTTCSNIASYESLNIFDGQMPLLDAALQRQWRKLPMKHDERYIASEYNKLKTMFEQQVPVTVNFDVFAEPLEILDILRIQASISSGFDLDNLILTAGLFPVVSNLDITNIAKRTCNCKPINGKLLIDHLELMGASYDCKTHRICIPTETSVESREPTQVLVEWIRHTCNIKQETVLLPIYNSEGYV
eukprot:XP_001610860.1 cytoplasmic dynein heavy chain [Babesia bovis T2Bo]